MAAVTKELPLPPIVFAQRAGTLLVDLEVPDIVKDSAVIKLEKDSLYFRGTFHRSLFPCFCSSFFLPLLLQ